MVSLQRNYLTSILSEAKGLIKDSDNDKGGFLLYRVFRGLPKNKALIKFLSEEGLNKHFKKLKIFICRTTREMHQIDEELYFTIDEKNNQIELTDKGIK